MINEEEFYNNLIKYADILNKYENGNYKLDEEEFDFVKKFTKTKDANIKYSKEFDKIKDMARSERAKYIENYEKLKEAANSKTSTTEKIAETFDVAESNINTEELKDGKKLYVVYDSNKNKDIVLEDGGGPQSLTEELQKIQEEALEDSEDTIDDYTEIIEDKRINQNLELSFIPIYQLKEYIGSINSLTAEKINELDCLLKNAESLGIKYINIENAIGKDDNGKIFEVYYDYTTKQYKVSGTGDDLKDYAKEEEENNLLNTIDQNNERLQEMLNDSEKDEDQNNLQLTETEKPKQLTKEYKSNETNNPDEEDIEE